MLYGGLSDSMLYVSQDTWADIYLGRGFQARITDVWIFNSQHYFYNWKLDLLSLSDQQKFTHSPLMCFIKKTDW